MKKVLISIMIVCTVAALGLTGCGKKADTSKPIDQIQKEVQNMPLNELQKNAEAYAQEIQKKQGGVEKILGQVKQLSPTELLGTKGAKIKSDASKIQAELGELTQRYQIYAQKFQEKGGDPAQIKI